MKEKICGQKQCVILSDSVSVWGSIVEIECVAQHSRIIYMSHTETELYRNAARCDPGNKIACRASIQPTLYRSLRSGTGLVTQHDTLCAVQKIPALWACSLSA